MIGRHRPLLISIARHGATLDALCEDCSLPLFKDQKGRWVQTPPLAQAPLNGSSPASPAANSRSRTPA